MRVVQIVGYKKTGKTTVAERLIEIFTQKGLRTLAVKHSHSPDESGKTVDTERMMSAGAQCAYFCNETYTLRTTAVEPLEKILSDSVRSYDILLIEGYKSKVYPRIVCMNEGAESLLDGAFAITVCGNGGNDKESAVPVLCSDSNEDMQYLAELCMKLPHYPAGIECGGCGMTCRELYLARTCGEDFVCVAEKQGDISIIVNGVPIALAPFVANLSLQTFGGFVRSLKGYAPGAVEIKFTTRD